MMAPKTSAPPKSTGSSHPATIHIDKDGDLTLIISQNEQEFTVCSKALSQATPVFKVMLYGNFNEAKPADASIPWIVRLPDDDAEAATLLLNATHSNFDRMPKKVNAGNLHQALIFADKYDLTRYLDPWMHKWMNPHIKNLRRRRPDIPSSFAECCAIMGILNATGQRKWLCRMVDILCRNTRIGPAGTSASKAAITTVGVSVYTKISDHINSPFIPDAVGGDFLEQFRARVLGKIFEILKKACLDSLSGEPDTVEDCIGCKAGLLTCDAIVSTCINYGLGPAYCPLVKPTIDFSKAGCAFPWDDCSIADVMAKMRDIMVPKMGCSRSYCIEACNLLPKLIREANMAIDQELADVIEAL